MALTANIGSSLAEPPVPHGPSCDAKQGRSDCQQLLPAIRGVAFEAVPVGFLLTANAIRGPRYRTETLRVDLRVALQTHPVTAILHAGECAANALQKS